MSKEPFLPVSEIDLASGPDINQQLLTTHLPRFIQQNEPVTPQDCVTHLISEPVKFKSENAKLKAENQAETLLQDALDWLITEGYVKQTKNSTPTYVGTDKLHTL